MRRDDPGLGAGWVNGTTAPGRAGSRDAGLPGGPSPADARSEALRSGSADQLAALVARSARAAGCLIHFVDGDRLRLYGAAGAGSLGLDVTDVPVRGTLGGLVVATGEPLIVEDLEADPRVPAASPAAAGGPGAYLGQPVRDDDGTVIGICCVFDTAARTWPAEAVAAVAEAAQVSTRLITEQLARHALDQQRRFLDAVLDSLHDGVTACDADGRIVLVNARMQQMWADSALAPATAGDGTIEGLYDSAGRPRRGDDIGLFRALRGDPVRHQELVLRRPQRRTRHYLADAYPIIGPDGAVIGAVQAVHDVTRRRRAERFRMCELGVTTALAEAQTVEQAGPRVLEAVVGTLDWTHAELWLVDDAAGVTRPVACWSAPGWQRDIHVPDELPYGQGLAGRAWQVGKPLWIRDVGQPQSLISRETAASSRLHTALALPVRHGTDPLGVLNVFADAIEDPEDEVVALLSGIAAHIAQFVDRRLVEDLQRQLTRSKNEYLSLIGHELRTPLTSISAYTEILREIDADSLAQDGPALLEVVDRNTTQLRHIIDELLEMSALDTGQAALAMAPVDLAEVVRESVEDTRAAIVGAPLTLVADVPAELVLPGDRRRLRQIVDNLLGNAVKYSPDGGRISVRLRADGRAAELTVADTGIGVTPEDREKLFTRLYRSNSVRDRAIPGTGLGLALSRTVAQRHHGTIELLDHEGPGTTMVVRLPLDRR
jgi:signal transduction histidine kinase/PAS domain-containing protein